MALFYDFVSLDLRSKFPQVDHPQRATTPVYPSAEELEGLPPAERSALGDGPPPADMWQDWCDELRLSPEPPPLIDLVGAAEATANSAAKL